MQESSHAALKSPWPNGVAERFAGTCRRNLLDHVIALNERYLKRLIAEFLCYYHKDRTHLGLDMQAPDGRKAAKNTAANAKVVSMSRRGGLHHRYDLAA